MAKRILSATKRAIPRPFSFEWGKGLVIEEASIRVQMQHHSWEPAIQLLRFDDGSETLRFCVFHGKQFSRMPSSSAQTSSPRSSKKPQSTLESGRSSRALLNSCEDHILWLRYPSVGLRRLTFSLADALVREGSFETLCDLF